MWGSREPAINEAGPLVHTKDLRQKNLSAIKASGWATIGPPTVWSPSSQSSPLPASQSSPQRWGRRLASPSGGRLARQERPGTAPRTAQIEMPAWGGKVLQPRQGASPKHQRPVAATSSEPAVLSTTPPAAPAPAPSLRPRRPPSPGTTSASPETVSDRSASSGSASGRPTSRCGWFPGPPPLFPGPPPPMVVRAYKDSIRDPSLASRPFSTVSLAEPSSPSRVIAQSTGFPIRHGACRPSACTCALLS